MDPQTTWRSDQPSNSARSARLEPLAKTFHGTGSSGSRQASAANRWKEGWESFLQPSTPIRAAASLLTEEEFRKHPLSMQTTTASFASSAQQTQHSNGSDTWRVDFASQAKKMGQEVLAALAAPAEQSPFDEVRKPEVPRRPPATARPKRPPRRTLESTRRSRLAWTEIREDAQQAPQEVKTEAKPGKTEAKPEAKPEAKTEPQEEIKAEKAEEPQKPKDSTPSAPSSPRNAGGAGGKKSLFTAVKALMQVARDDEGSKLAQMLGAVTDRRSASPSVESELQSRGSRGSGLTDANSSRKGTPEPGGRRKSSNAHKGHRSQTALVKAAAAFKSALSAVAGATDTTTGGNRRLSVAERMAMTSGSRPTDKDKESTEERSDGRIQDKARSPTKQAEKGGQEAEVAQKPDTPVHEFAAQRRERGHGRWKWQSQPFEAPLCSFQELVNVENNPTPLSEAMERVRSLAGGQNFTWERSSGAYGGRLHISFPIVLWYQHSWENEIKKSRTSCVVSFVHKPGCAFVYQPTVPVTTLLIEPKQLFRPMFQFDPRSFHTFKLAWRHYLDFGSTDYRVIVGGELERWCQRCKTAIEKPFNAVYWLLLMIGSHYRESLASRRVVSKLEDPPEQVPIICIDSFVALSALLFSPERQVLYAGVDPTPSYLRWLQYIGDQYTFNKAPEMPDSHTVFEMNEFLDLPAVIIFYGRPQHRGRESDPLAWVNSPALIKSYIARYSEDNKCGCQVELAARLYTYSCSLGCCTTSPSNQNVDSEPDKTGNDAEKWYCWNGLKVCEIGVPVPHTQASFLSPFVSTRQVAFLCPAHGPDRLSKNTSPRAHRQVHRGDSKNSVAASHLDGEGDVVDEQTRSSSQKTMSLISNMDGGLESGAPSEVASDAGDDEDSDSRKSWSFNTQMGGFSGGPSPRSEKTSPGQRCTCGQYIHASQQQGLGKKDKQAKSSQGDSMVTAGAEAQEVRQALSALGEYDLLHTFVGLMSGGLNMAKSVLRLHFSIDPAAYQNLPEPACKQWDVGLMPWYREFHRMDMHSRSRHGMLLASLLRGMLGDGLTSGLHDESLDMLRLPLPMAPTAADERGSLQPRPAAGRAAGHVQTVPLSVAMRSHSFMRSQSQDSIMSNDDKPERQAEADARSGSKAVPKRFLNNVQVCCALVGCESPLGLKHHFEAFNQWCHSAHLLPFVKRCYRRCGIAGLAAGQHVGHHKKGANPFYPLVLPTVPTVCYGHCYPLHKVFQYFYAGTEKILCSIDDSKAVEADRATWGLAPGQDRLNNQCWFKVADDHDIPRDESPTAKPSPAKQMRMLLTAGGLPGPSDSSDALARPTSAMREPSKGKGSLSRSAFFSKQGVTGLKSLEDDKKQHMTAARRKQLVLKRQQAPMGPGMLTAADPFFWFCHGDFYLYTFPANQVPRSFLQDPTTVVCRYADFVSRSGTPVRRSDAAVPAEAAADAPPSSCLCQPTDMTDHLRKRWEVPVVFPDEQRLLLGDCGWFPGALGFRFVFEASTQNVERYVLLDTMPQASLVYMQHVWRPDRKVQKVNPKDARRQRGAFNARQELHSSESSGEDSESDVSDSKEEEPFTAAHRRRLPYFYKRKKGTKKTQKEVAEDKGGWETVDYMLPPLPG